ncbi:MAG TPA: LLM class flavin-dependent oxidoreductase [Dehalococcoidia bacterium]|nr:LLM class flavin-dependent oxidoreductase [Dehalococcoidia bacterium]
MKLGFFVTNQYLPGESMPQKVQESAEQVRAAREAGFDLIATGQHYLAMPYQMSTSFPLLARLAAEAGDMQVAATVVLVPLHNPVELAESVATMDAICGGRFILGVGLGYREEEYTAFGVQRGQRVGRLREALEVMKRLWAEEELEFHGKYYQVPRVRPATRPVQQPHPPIWVAANGDAAVRRAARWGYPWLINPHATVPMLTQQLSAYRQTLAQSGQPVPPTLPMMRELYVAQDRETACLESQPYLGPKYQAYASWGQDKALPGQESFAVPYQDLARDRFLLGSPEEVVQEIKRYEQTLGVNYLIFRMQWPGMPQAQVLRQIELMGREVIPLVKG